MVAAVLKGVNKFQMLQKTFREKALDFNDRNKLCYIYEV
jgi:hypothetical protein